MANAPCGRWNWRWKPRGVNGCGNGYRRNYRTKPSGWVRFFPLGERPAWHRRQETLHLDTTFGRIKLKVWRGKNPVDQTWGIPLRQRWGLLAHQRMSPALEERLAYFVTVTGAYETAARLALKVGIRTDDARLHALIQRLGQRAQEQSQARLQTVAEEKDPQRAPSPLGVLLLDGFLVRHRGPGWGGQKTLKNRVEWHEQKVGVFYRHEQSVPGQLVEKVVVSGQEPPWELSRRLHWQAQRHGLNRARQLLALGDGADWIWNTVADRWPSAHQLLDFYHASQHLWSTGEVYQRAEAARRPWVESQLHQLRHGKEKQVLQHLASLPKLRGERGKILQREQNYFAGHAHRLNYAQVARRGWPIGSGAVESACRQKQGRFKCRGQFWSQSGLARLNALMEARDLDHWDQLWSAN